MVQVGHKTENQEKPQESILFSVSRLNTPNDLSTSPKRKFYYGVGVSKHILHRVRVASSSVVNDLEIRDIQTDNFVIFLCFFASP